MNERLAARIDDLGEKHPRGARDRAVRLRGHIHAIAEDAERIAGAGERSAEQAAMSLETLLGTLVQNRRRTIRAGSSRCCAG